MLIQLPSIKGNWVIFQGYLSFVALLFFVPGKREKMSTTQLRLVWAEHDFDQIVTSFDFRIDFNLDDEDIYCGKFDPAGAINFEGQPLEVIYFKDFTYEEKQFSFNFPNGKSSRFTISNTKTEIPVKFTIIPPGKR